MSNIIRELRWIWMALGSIAALCGTPSNQLLADKPNLVVFFSDDHGQKDSTPWCKRCENAKHAAIGRAGPGDDARVCRLALLCAKSCSYVDGLMPARNGAEANHTSKRADVRSLIQDLTASWV